MLKTAPDNDSQTMRTIVRTHDWQRYLCSLLLPKAERHYVWTLIAYNSEIARIPDMVTEPIAGHMRYTWWRDALQEIEQGKATRSHPVTQALKTLYAYKPVIFPLLHAVLDARETLFSVPAFADEEAFQGYLDSTAATLLLAQHILVTDQQPTAEITQLGLAYGYVGHAELLIAGNGKYSPILPQNLPEADALLSLCQKAESHLSHVSTHTKKLLPGYATIVERFITMARKKHYHVHNIPLHIFQRWLPLALFLRL